MNFFKRFYIPSTPKSPDDTIANTGGDVETVEDDAYNNRDICSPFKRIYLSPSLFTDASAANDYVCKICHFMAVDPLEHVPGPNVTCSNIFCLPCVQTYSASGLSSCPAEGCLTTGFAWSSLRDLGTREIARLSNLTLNCEFNCSQVIPYRDYWVHREKCPANPENFCETCDSPKTNDSHSCREVFILLRKKDETLVKENSQLKAEIDKLRCKLNSLRGERAAEKMANGTSTTYSTENNNKANSDNLTSSTTTVNTSNASTASTAAGEDETGNKTNTKTKVGLIKGNKQNVNSNYPDNDANRENPRDTKPSPNNQVKNMKNEPVDGAGFLRGAVPQFKFHSNCFMNKSIHSRIRLIFHYGEKSYKIDDVQSTFTFRTLRSLLHDMMKHDPGIMLLVSHRILNDRETIASCGFQPGYNSISLVPYDTPDFNEPGFRLGLYRLKHASDPLNAKKVPPGTIKPHDIPFISKDSIDFYSNSLEPQTSEKDVTLNFYWNGKDISLERVKRDQTIGSVRTMVDFLIESDCGKMMHITHQLIRDDMTVRSCGIGFGTTDITLLPACFPIDLSKTRTLHLLRFLNNGKLAKKFTGKLKSRTNSMASLV